LKSLGEYWDLGTGYTFAIANSSWNGRLQDCLNDIEEAESFTRQMKTYQGLCWILFFKSILRILVGDNFESIVRDIEEGGRLAKQINAKPSILLTSGHKAFALLRQGNYEAAIQNIEKTIEMFTEYFNRGVWALIIFVYGAQIYTDYVRNQPSLAGREQKKAMSRARWFCKQAFRYRKKFPFLRGWAYQVNGTYLWLCGKRKKAIKTWEQGIKYLREQTEDKYRLAYTLMEEASFLLQDDSSDAKAQQYLLEAKELFSQMGCVKDMQRAEFLLAGGGAGEHVEGKEVLTQKRHLDSLLSVTRAIGSEFDLEGLLQKIMDYAINVTGAERGFLLLYDDKNALKLNVARGVEDSLVKQAFSYENYKVSLELVQSVEKDKDARIAGAEEPGKVGTDLKEYSIKQAICVPLQAREKFLGVIYLDNSLAGGMFGNEELELMKSFAVQASVSIENAYLVQNMVEQERLQQEMELGRKIQHALLPQATPQVTGAAVSGLMETAQEIGGDYFDFIEYTDENRIKETQMGADSAVNKLGIVVADVSGKGLDAGMVMGMTKATIYSLSEQDLTPRDLIIRLNTLLCKQLYQQKFISLIYAEYTSDGKFTWSGAGHERVLVFRRSTQNSEPSTSYVEVIKTGGLVLGMESDIARFIDQQSIQLNQGDKVVLYTDGVTEARNPASEMFTLDRMLRYIQNNASQKSVSELLNGLKTEVHSFIKDAPQYDDITLVGIEKT